MKKKLIKNFICNKLFSGALLLLLFQTGITIFLPKLVQMFLDAILENRVEFRTLGIYLFLSCVLYAAEQLKKYFSSKCAWQTVGTLREKLVQRILKYRDSFFKNTDTGEWLLVFNDDIKTIESFLENSMMQILSGILTVFGIVIAMFYENKGIAVFFCIYVLISVGYIIQMQKKKQSYLAKERSRKSEYISACYEWYQARKDIKNSGKIPSIFRELKCRMQGYGDSMVLAQKALYSIWMVSLFVVFLGNAIALLGGGILAFQNLISIGTVYLFYSYGQQLKAPMDDLQTLMRNLLSLHTSLDRVEGVMNYEEVQEGIPFPRATQDAVFSVNIPSHFYNQKKILEHMKLQIHPGDRIALMGESGCGKSTLCRLLSRQEPVQNGEIQFCGTNIQEINQEEYGHKVLYLSGNPELFHGTLKENLTSFHSEINKEEILKELEVLGITNHTFHGFDFEEHMDCILEEKELSYDIAQMINMLRISFVKPILILFDEALTNVEFDQEFVEILEHLIKDSMVIFVTHEKKKTAVCNRLIKMESGKIIYDTYQ